MYHLVYRMTPYPEGTEATSLNDNEGACDGAVLISVVTDEEQMSLCTVSVNGKTGKPYSSSETFNFWLALAAGLARNPSLSINQRAIAAVITAAVVQSPHDRQDPTSPDVN